MKVGMVSLGCPKNQVDAEVMMGLVKKAGHTVTAKERDAEVIIVNTCAFIREATEESIEAVLELAELKETGKLKYLITTGCLAERYKDGLMKELPEVDAYLGTGEFDRIAEVIDGLSKGASERPHQAAEQKYIYSHDTPRLRFTPRHWSYVKISDGCDNRCSYCVIPILRGPMRSRLPVSVTEEARMLASQGVKEICIIAQDTTAYGADRKDNNMPTLAGLLRELEGVDGLSWIRVLYTHPAHFTDELVELIKGSEKVLHYLDIPIQHIDDDLLKRMGRKVTSREIRKLFEMLKGEIPDLTLRTSLMVGFPGETREKFMDLLRFVKETEFDHLGVFGYSEEEGTAAAGMGAKVSEELMHERRDQIMKAQNKISMRKNKGRVGRTFKVLVDGPSKESELLIEGHAYFQAPMVDGVIYITEGEAKSGEFVDVEITEAHPYDLVGRAGAVKRAKAKGEKAMR
jgi:ribosomal protein S12 methylthiotransferase